MKEVAREGEVMEGTMKLALAAMLSIVVLMVPEQAGATSGTMQITSDTVLTEDHVGSIVIAADNVTLDCAGHTIAGIPGQDEDVGVVVSSRSGIAVQNCRLSDFTQGLSVADSSGVTVEGNHSSNNPGNGFFIVSSSATTLVDNTGMGNGAQGIHIDASTGSILEGNRFVGSGGAGIVLTNSTHSSFEANRSSRNGRGLVLIESTNNVFRENEFTANTEPGAGWGILLVAGSSQNRFFGNTIQANQGEGFLLVDGSDNNVIAANAVTDNVGGGVTLLGSSGNWIAENRVMHNQAGGISTLEGSSLNQILRNLACRNGIIDAYDDGTGTGNVWRANRICTSSI